MTMHLERDLENLRKKLVTLGSMVEQSTARATEFLETKNDAVAEEIKGLEQRVNDMEVEVEEDCLKILALHQPVAIDLRFIIVVLKVNNDLERMGDQAVNIVSRVSEMTSSPGLAEQLRLKAMSVATMDMVRQSIDALVNQDAELAHKVVEMDDQVDELHARNYSVLREYSKAHPEAIDAALSFGTISANLERIADLSTNIAEDVLFMIEGEVMRHRD